MDPTQDVNEISRTDTKKIAIQKKDKSKVVSKRYGVWDGFECLWKSMGFSQIKMK